MLNFMLIQDISSQIVERVKLFNLADKIFQGISPSRHSKINQYGQNMPLINIKDMVNGQIHLDDLQIVSVDYKYVGRYVVQSGDVLITSRGTVLKSAVVPDNLTQSLITSNLIAIRLSDRFNPLLLAAFFRSSIGQKSLLSSVRSSTMQLALTVSDIKNLEIPIFPFDIQKELAGLITAANNYYTTAIESANLRREIAYNIVNNSFIQSMEGKGE